MFSGYNISNYYDICDECTWCSGDEAGGRDLVDDEKAFAVMQDADGISLVQQINQLSLFEDTIAVSVRPPAATRTPESQKMALAKAPPTVSTAPAPVNPVYCSMCRVKCRLAMQFACKHCLAIFCPSHRYPDIHSCQAR